MHAAGAMPGWMVGMRSYPCREPGRITLRHPSIPRVLRQGSKAIRAMTS